MKKNDDRFSFFEIFRSRIAKPLLEFIPIPEDTVTNAAFGGPDLQTLYVTAGKTLFRLRTDIKGTRR